MKDADKLLRESNAYQRLKVFGSQVPQQVIRQVLTAFKTWFRALTVYKKYPEKFLGRPKMPRYRKRGGKNLVTFTGQQSRIRDGHLLLVRHMMERGFPKIPFVVPHSDVEFRCVRIVPRHSTYAVEMVYRIEPTPCPQEPQRKVAIDLGLQNFVAMTNNFDNTSLLIKGGVLRAENQLFNKRLAKARSLAMRCNTTTDTAKIRRMLDKHSLQIADFFHKASRRVIEYCKNERVSELIIGYNTGWKQKINMGKRTNQRFVSVPFHRFLHMLTYKAALYGIQVTTITEEYTSQTCSHCGIVRKANRRHRGLYVCSKCGISMNADLNASCNILHKVIPKSIRIWDSGRLNRPMVFTAL